MLRKGEAEVVGFLVGDRALVGAGLDLVQQDVARPPQAGGGMEIPEAGHRIGDLIENDQVLAPWDFCDELSQKFDGCRALGFQACSCRFLSLQFCDSLPQNWPCPELRPLVRSLGKDGGICAGDVESAHVPNIPCRKAGRFWEFSTQVGSDKLHHRLAPSERLLPLHDPLTDIPVEQDDFGVHRADCGNPGGQNSGLQGGDEVAVFRADQQGGVGAFKEFEAWF